MRGITRDCIVEMFDRKLIYVFAIVTVLALFIVLMTASFDTEIHVQTSGNMDMEEVNDMLGNPAMNGFSFFLFVLVFLAVLGTAGLMPSMLERGRADYYLSKPISRTSLFFSKFFGIFVVYGGVITLCGLIVYLAMGFMYNFFAAGVIYIILFALLNLFIWMSVTSFSGVVFGSNAIAIMSAFIVWVLQFLLDKREFMQELLRSKTFNYVTDSIYYIIPKTGALDNLALRLAVDRVIRDWVPLYSSVLFALVVIFATVTIFRKKNY
ncbi:MAG: ABC transporter permease [Candidatus Zixiibacteriota bacterium]